MRDCFHGCLGRGPERRLGVQLEEHNLAFIPWFPVAAGKLARPGGPLDAVARNHQATIAQLSLAWLLHHSPVLLPIPGTSSVKHLEENMASAKLHLSSEEWKTIETAAAENSKS